LYAIPPSYTTLRPSPKVDAREANGARAGAAAHPGVHAPPRQSDAGRRADFARVSSTIFWHTFASLMSRQRLTRSSLPGWLGLRHVCSLVVTDPTSTASMTAYTIFGFGPIPPAPDPAAREHLIPT